MILFLCASLFLFSNPQVAPTVQELAPPSSPQAQWTPLERDYSQQDLDRMGLAAFEAVRLVQPTELKSVTFRLVELEEMQEVLFTELRPQMDFQFEDEDQADSNARILADTMATAVIAKFATHRGEILVVRNNVFLAADLIKAKELASEEAFAAVLCHEVAHAIDHHVHPLHDMFNNLQDADHLQAVNAVVEGHAQRVARKACAQAGNSRGFEIFTFSIDHLPESHNAQEDYVKRIAVAQLSFAYKDGERFMDAVFHSGGQEALDKVFQAPPTESVLISEPSWYIDPKGRPKSPYDIAQSLAGYEARLTKETPEFWTTQTVRLLAPQIRAALSLLPEERYEPSIKDILECRVLIAQNEEGEGSFISAGLFALSTVPKARLFLELERELIAAKPEKLKGSILIDIHTNEVLVKEDSNGLEGSWIEQTITVGSQEIRSATLLAQRGQVVAELSFTGLEVTKAEAIQAAENLLKAPLPAPAPEGPVGK